MYSVIQLFACMFFSHFLSICCRAFDNFPFGFSPVHALLRLHSFLFGSDGLWDVITDSEAAFLIRDMKNAQNMSQALVDIAMRRGTTDNVSVMVVRLLP